MGADCATPDAVLAPSLFDQRCDSQIASLDLPCVDLVAQRIAVYAKSWTVEERDHERQLDRASGAHARSGRTIESELTRSDIERCQRETVRRLEAAVIEAERKARTEAIVDPD